MKMFCVRYRIVIYDEIFKHNYAENIFKKQLVKHNNGYIS